MTAIDPMNVPCTYCGRLAGDPCRQSPHRYYGDLDHAPLRRRPHAARVKLAASGWQPRRHDGDLVAEPVQVVYSRSVEVRCPHCARTHWHGWGPDMRVRYTPRVSHCHADAGDYVIAPTWGMG